MYDLNAYMCTSSFAGMKLVVFFGARISLQQILVLLFFVLKEKRRVRVSDPAKDNS